MSIVSFLKEAGEKLFGHGGTAAAPAAAAAPDATALAARVVDANQTAAAAIAQYIAGQGLTADGLVVGFDSTTAAVRVAGAAADQATREKIVLCCGNVQGVSQVVDDMTVAAPEEASRYYTVVRGDTLSAISKAHYGSAGGYMKIFEANRPMLSNPDKIYPGQVLRVPA